MSFTFARQAQTLLRRSALPTSRVLPAIRLGTVASSSSNNSSSNSSGSSSSSSCRALGSIRLASTSWSPKQATDAPPPVGVEGSEKMPQEPWSEENPPPPPFPDSPDMYTHETFFSGFWLRAVLFTVAGVVIYRNSPTYNRVAGSRSSASSLPDPDDIPHPDDVDKDKENWPWLTKWIDSVTPDPAIWKDNAEKHLERVLLKAEDRLFFDSAEAPAVRRLDSGHAQNTGSPIGRRIGSSASGQQGQESEE